jgi:PIN domain nuclease of toxin-antitoxin system
MRVLLDTHVLLGLIKGTLETSVPSLARRLSDPSVECLASVVSVWEIAIKARLGKLDPGMSIQQIGGWAERMAIRVLPIEIKHVIAFADPEPPTKDPFDRLLLAICQVDGLRIATVDQALANHPLALDTSRQFP